MFWLFGILGSGKTILTTCVLDDLWTREIPSVGFRTFFFCQYNKPDSLKAHTILRCILRQCLSINTLSKIIEDCIQKLVVNHFSDADQLEDLFQKVFDESEQKHFVVIDGFDEVPQHERDVVLTTLGHTISYSRSTIKTFIASRQDIRKEVDRVFEHSQRRSTNCLEVEADISTYVNLSIADRQGKGNLVFGDPALCDAVRDALIEGANGM